MNRSGTRSSRGLRAIGSVILALLLFAAFAASAQDITVTSADPAEAEQGTLGLVVKISGSNFAKDSKVSFLVTGTTNPGGITVRSVKYRNPKSLEATIDVASDAQTQNRFDIQVMSGGRTGKGTELFSVKVKTTGGDLTPPGTVAVPDLRAIQTGFNTAVLTWTAPANDGFDASSGPAAQYDLRVRKATPEAECGPYTIDVWGTNGWKGIQNEDPCQVYASGPVASAPGATEAVTALYLSPHTGYWATLRTADASPQGPNWSDFPAREEQLYFETGAFPPQGWTAPWVARVVDACPVLGSACRMYALPRLDFGSDGNPVMQYEKDSVPTLATWTGDHWTIEPLPIAVDNWNHDFAIDPWSGEATIASVAGTKPELRFYRRTASGWTTETLATGSIGGGALGFAPGSPVATVAYTYTKGSTSQLRVAELNGASWRTTTVASGVSGALAKSVAFDLNANPAVTFSQSVNGANRLAFALRQEATWSVEAGDPVPPGAPWNAVNESLVTFDPSRNDFSAAARYYDAATGNSLVRFCERASATWSCRTVAEGTSLHGIYLASASSGTVYLAYRQKTNFVMLVRPPLAAEFAPELIDWNIWSSPGGDLHIGPDGQLVIAYGSANDWTGAGGSDGNYAVSIARRAAWTSTP
jgi:hypothetical protein